MHLKFRNVNDAFRGLVLGIYSGAIPTDIRPSRYGEVVEVTEPVTLTYSHPRERVLFNAARDANPFALLYEALWMLAGRNDVAPMAYYTPRFAEFSDDGETLNDAYGYRWRQAAHGAGRRGNRWYGGILGNERDRVDQLGLLVAHLKDNPWSRRAVLQMWNVEDDLLRVNSSKAVCCNLSALFSVGPGNDGMPARLNMIVISRSEDLVWGLLGTDYVIFSFLQEYLATRLGLEVGVYHHVTNNLHAYTANWKPEEWLGWEDAADRRTYSYEENRDGVAPCAGWKLFPLVQDPVRFEKELPAFVETFGGENWRQPVDYSPVTGGYDLHRKTDQFTEPFLRDVAAPLFLAFRARKVPGQGAYVGVSLANVKVDDWRIAATTWIERRAKKHATSK